MLLGFVAGTRARKMLEALKALANAALQVVKGQSSATALEAGGENVDDDEDVDAPASLRIEPRPELGPVGVHGRPANIPRRMMTCTHRYHNRNMAGGGDFISIGPQSTAVDLENGGCIRYGGRQGSVTMHAPTMGHVCTAVGAAGGLC